MNALRLSFYILILTTLLSCGSGNEDNTMESNDNIVGNNDPLSFGATLAQQSYTAALHTANYLIAQAHTIGDNQIYWYRSNHSTVVSYGQDEGVTAIGRFFLHLYRVSGNSNHLNYAEGASNYLVAQLNSTNISQDWYGGHAGVGEFLLEMYQETTDLKWLIAAELIANAIVNDRIIDNSGGVYWRYESNPSKFYTGIAHGNGGAGLFLMKLFSINGDHNLLATGLDAFTWLELHKIRINDESVAWKRLAQDDFIYHGWCSGAAGMVPMFEQLYNATNDIKYKNLLREVGSGLTVSAIPQNSGSAWYRDMGSGRSFFTTYCQGSAGIVDTLFHLQTMFPESNFGAVAEEGLDWLESESISYEQGGVYWPVSQDYRRFDTGYQMGVASVARAFITGFRASNNPEYLHVVEKASELLLRIAHRPTNDQLYWNSEISVTSFSEEPHTSLNGWHAGNAGIGMYWLEVHRLLTGS